MGDGTTHTYAVHCLHCSNDYVAGAQSSHCPHNSLHAPREIDRAAKLRDKSDWRTAERLAKRGHGKGYSPTTREVIEIFDKRRERERLRGGWRWREVDV